MTADQTIDGMLAAMQGVVDFHERCLVAPDLSPAAANIIRSLRDGAKAARDAALKRAREDDYRRESMPEAAAGGDGRAQSGRSTGSPWEPAGPGDVCGHCGQEIGEGFACTRAKDGTPFHDQCPVEWDVGPHAPREATP